MKPKKQEQHLSSRRVKIRHTKNRTRNGQVKTPSTLQLGQFGKMSRIESLEAIQHYLTLNPIHPLAQSLIDLFQIHGEELTETGVSYEIVKALEKEYPLLNCLNA